MAINEKKTLRKYTSLKGKLRSVGPFLISDEKTRTSIYSLDGKRLKVIEDFGNISDRFYLKESGIIALNSREDEACVLNKELQEVFREKGVTLDKMTLEHHELNADEIIIAEKNRFQFPLSPEGKPIGDTRKYGDVSSLPFCPYFIVTPTSFHGYWSSNYHNYAAQYGLMDINGNEVLSPRFVLILKWFSNNTFLAATETFYQDDATIDDKYGIFDVEGKPIVENIGNEYGWFDEEREEFWMHVGDWLDKHWGIMDKNGQWVIEPRFFEWTIESNGNLILFGNKYLDDDCSVFNLKTGKVVIDHIDYPDFLPDGRIFGYLLNDPKKVYTIFDRKGNVLKKVEGYDEDSYRMFYLEDQFISYRKVSEDCTIVSVFDLEGEKLFEFKNSREPELHDFRNSFSMYALRAQTEQGEAVGLINKEGKKLFDPIFKSVELGYSKELVPTQSFNGLWGLVDYLGNVLLDNQYQSIDVEDNKVLAYSESGVTEVYCYE